MGLELLQKADGSGLKQHVIIPHGGLGTEKFYVDLYSFITVIIPHGGLGTVVSFAFASLAKKSSSHTVGLERKFGRSG